MWPRSVWLKNSSESQNLRCGSTLDAAVAAVRAPILDGLVCAESVLESWRWPERFPAL